MSTSSPIYDLFKKSAELIKPKEKVIISKNCKRCERKFEMKEGDLEIYIILEYPYPTTCQKCIDESAKEKRIREDLENELKKNAEKEEEKKEEVVVVKK